MSSAAQADSQTTKAVVQRFYAAIFSGNDDEIRECLHEDAELHQPPTLPYGGVYRGRADMMKLWKDVILRLADPGSASIGSFVAEGDVAVAIADAKTNHDGSPIIACEEYTVRDGKIARIRMFWYDPAPVAAAARALAAETA